MAWSKESRHARGYGSQWDKLRLTILKRDSYLCQIAIAEGRFEPATEVDHIVSKAAWLKKHGTLAGVDDPGNLQAVGKARHAEKTAREMGGTPKVATGADGYPVAR